MQHAKTLSLAAVLAAAPACDWGGGTSNPAEAKCPATATIEDAENNDHQLMLQDGRGGYIYTYGDEEGTEIDPLTGAKGGTFAMTAGGANGSGYAARFHGKLADASVVYAGVGMNFVDPKGAYDASRFQGVSFLAKRGAGSTGSVRLKVPDVHTDPDGGVCAECFNDFGADFEIGEDWAQYTFMFKDMTQMAGWGSPRPSGIQSSQIYALQWQVASAGAAFDIWIDDVKFVGCK